MILEPNSAATTATQPVGTGPYKLESWVKGSTVTLAKWDGYRDAGDGRDRQGHVPHHQRPGGAGGGAALRATSTRIPRFAGYDSLQRFQDDPRFPVDGRRHRRQDDPRHQQRPQAVRRRAGAPGAQLRGRPPVGDRRRVATDFGTPIGSHYASTDPGYVDLTGDVPVRSREGARRSSKEAGVRTPLQRDAHPAAAALRPPGRRDHRRRAGPGRRQRQDRERRVGAVAVGVYKDKNYDLTVISHVEPLDSRHLRQPELLLPVRLAGLPGDLRAS